MSKAIAFADRACGVALGILALTNLLFVISFMAILLSGATAVKADQIAACKGENLLTRLEQEEPEKLAAIRKTAAGTPNGQGLLWKIEKDGAEPSFLFGTMHLTDERVTTLTPSAQAAFDVSNAVIIETTDILDQNAAALSLMGHPELMMLPDSTTLTSLLEPDEAEIVRTGLGERGIPPGSIIKMQPWLLTAIVSIPACEHARRKAGLPVLDAKLAQDAQKDGKAIAGLETAVSQLQAMASLPLEFHVDGLVQTLQLGDRMGDVFETLIVLYQQGDTGLVWPLFRAILPSTGGAGYGEFERVMVTARNYGMVENAKPYLNSGGAFIAVGALHLPGKEGVVELLRQAGYSVIRAD